MIRDGDKAVCFMITASTLDSNSRPQCNCTNGEEEDGTEDPARVRDRNRRSEQSCTNEVSEGVEELGAGLVGVGNGCERARCQNGID
jgi:hypothetical protein